MSLVKTVSRSIMHFATRNPPSQRRDWALAMKREFDVLESGHLNWAVGCLGASTAWKLGDNRTYIILLLVAPLVLQLVLSFPTDFIVRSLAGPIPTNLLLGSTFVLALLISAALGAYQPRHVGATAAGVTLIPILAPQILISISNGTSLSSWWGPEATLFMAPPVVGLLAMAGVCYFGASTGARFSASRSLTVG